MNNKLTYKNSGVDLEKANSFVKNIQPLAERVKRSEVISDIGGFAGLFQLKKYDEPVLVSSSDGVGTKLIVANMVDKHDSIGIDLVAMCVNDIITYGAEPLFFLDYIAASKLDEEKTTSIVKGIVKGCQESGCALLGGETAEMPGLYSYNSYDIAGFVVGVVEKENIIDHKKVDFGDVIIGLGSSGLHSNGFSLCRKLFFEEHKLSPFSYMDAFNRPLFEELLEPTRIYVKPVLEVVKKFNVKSIANITGGGFIDNIPRSVPQELQATIRLNTWSVPKIFKLIQNMAGLETIEMLNIFNMGIGMVLIVDPNDTKEIINIVNKFNIDAFEIGKISKRKHRDKIVFKK